MVAKNCPVDSVDTLRANNFIEIALSHTISKTNVLLHFTQKFKMAAKMAEKFFHGNLDSTLRGSKI